MLQIYKHLRRNEMIPAIGRAVPFTSTMPLTSLKTTLWPVWRPCGWLSMQVTTPRSPWRVHVGKKRIKCVSCQLGQPNECQKGGTRLDGPWWRRSLEYLSYTLDKNLLGLLSCGIRHLELLSKVTKDPRADAVCVTANELQRTQR